MKLQVTRKELELLDQLYSLYVAVTRATKRIAVVHREPLPAILTGP